MSHIVEADDVPEGDVYMTAPVDAASLAEYQTPSAAEPDDFGGLILSLRRTYHRLEQLRMGYEAIYRAMDDLQLAPVISFTVRDELSTTGVGQVSLDLSQLAKLKSPKIAQAVLAPMRNLLVSQFEETLVSMQDQTGRLLGVIPGDDE